MGELLANLVNVLVILAIGAGVMWVVIHFLGAAAPARREISAIAEQVRSVGKLIGLEVHAKEIATAKKGWSWMPPIVLSQARLAMIFQFEKQYYVDLGAIKPHDISSHGIGSFRIKMPPVQGSLRLLEVKPYDIQQGKMLGLLDVIPMTAERQGALMDEAQNQAAELFDKSDERYQAQAIDSIERHLRSLLGLTGAVVEFVWPTPQGQIGPLETDEPALQHRNALPAGKAAVSA
ncbi:MAG: DUF4230 domain-containing protein [Phycisphaeraceae bacterium]|nr:MAG: DUF4230 domain-containing protein [Phycisphaeraceae bacterium]